MQRARRTKKSTEKQTKREKIHTKKEKRKYSPAKYEEDAVRKKNQRFSNTSFFLAISCELATHHTAKNCAKEELSLTEMM